jgi:uncharacterized protein (DUF427 family)
VRVISRLLAIITDLFILNPSPPALEPVLQRLRVVWTSAEGDETVLADSAASYRVLETRWAARVQQYRSSLLTNICSHPPTYYIPPSDVKTSLLSRSAKSSFCEVSTCRSRGVSKR